MQLWDELRLRGSQWSYKDIKITLNILGQIKRMAEGLITLTDIIICFFLILLKVQTAVRQYAIVIKLSSIIQIWEQIYKQKALSPSSDEHSQCSQKFPASMKIQCMHF